MTTVSDLLRHLGGVPVGGIFTDGEVFFVDPTSGSDTQAGDAPDNAFATLQTAIDNCEDDRGDVIIRLPGSENPTAAITFNKAGIVVMSAAVAGGYGTNPWQCEKFSTYPASSYDSGPTAIITKPVRLIGLEFVTRNTSAGTSADMSDSGAAIAIDGDDGGYAGGFNHIAYCRFVDWWGNAYGLEFRGGAYNLVENCVFESFDAGIAFRGGTRNPAHNHVINCHFVDCTNGIEHIAGGTPGNFLYRGNTFVDYTDAIDFNDQAANGLVCENNFETATDAATYDITVAAAQAHGVQFAGNNYSE